MQHTVKDLPKNMREIRIEFPASELKPYMERAAEKLSMRTKIEGFRPGKASYEVMKGRFGEGAILEEALPEVVRKSLVEVIKKDALETIGEPSINVEKAVPGNDVVFTAKVAILPKVKKLPNLEKIKIKSKDTDVNDEEVENVVKELQKMQKSEHVVEREAKGGDKITVNMVMSLDKVTVEGGTVRDHHIYLDEEYFVPGLKEKVLGMKKGDKREFILKFPKEHFQKNLAGKDVEFSVELKEVNELRRPELNEEFAAKLGKKNMDELRALLRKNLEDEAKNKEKQRQEIAVIEELIKKADFDDIPELLVNSQAQSMLHEFQHSIEQQGMSFDDYLAKIGKKRSELLLDYTPEAVKRAKSAILIRKIADENHIEPSDADVLKEQAKMMNTYKEDTDTQERIRSEEGLNYIRMVQRNRKVMEYLRETCVK